MLTAGLGCDQTAAGETIHIVAILRDPKDGCHVSLLPKAYLLSNMTPDIDTERGREGEIAWLG